MLNQNNMRDYDTVLITGATSGIGYELAKLFAADKYNLVVVSRFERTLHEVAEQFHALGAPNVFPVVADLSIAGAAANIYQQTRLQGMEVNILINNAGAGEHGLFCETSIERDLSIVQLNVSSMIHLTKLYACDMLLQKRGRILQLASIASYQPTPLLSVYAATKAFILSFTDSLINELEGTGVTVTALIPGPTRTDFFRKAHASQTKVAQNDLADPADIARIGYEALLQGKHHAVTGSSVKADVIMSNILSRESVASRARKQMEIVS
jgi:short-subunit dehydrogenase